MSNEIVEPVSGVFTFIGDDGKGLKDIAMQLNDEWAMYMVRRVGDDAQLKGLERTFEEVKEGGVDRGTMISVESMKLGELNENYPISSYTLKRSRTNQKVALEEIGSRIIEGLKKAYRFILNAIKRGLAHIGTYVAKAKQALKRKKGQDLKVETEKEGLFSGANFLSADQIRKDPKLSAIAEAITENYSELLEVILKKASFRNAFQNLVEDTGSFAKKVLDQLTILNSALSNARSKSFSDALTTLSKIELVEPPASFNSFIQYLGSDKKESLLETIIEANSVIQSMASESDGIDPFNLNSLTLLLKTAVGLLSAQKPIFVFDDDQLESIILKSIQEVTAAEKEVDQLSQMHDNIRSDVNRAFREKMSVINESNKIVVFIISHAERFFNEVSVFSTNLTHYLSQCKVK